MNNEASNFFLHGDIDIIIPVPLHRRRLRERGFNQATLIANALATHLGAPVQESVLIRTRHTHPQFELPPANRRENVRKAFYVTQPDAIRNKVVLLVDDVMTIGATLDECARTLRRAKPKAIYAVTFARALRM